MARDVSDITYGGQKRTSFLLVEIEDASPIYYTNWDVNVAVVIDSVFKVFTPNAITATGLGQDGQRGGVEGGSIRLQNIDNVIGGVALGAGGMLGRRIQIWEGFQDPNGVAFEAAKKLFDGRADSCAWDEKWATINLVPHDTPWILLVPAHQFFTACVNKFKGSLCQYAGPDTTCDRTYAACQLKANTQNFNGFRFLPDPSRRYFWSGGGDHIPTREA